jgi:hypothetical protein
VLYDSESIEVECSMGGEYVFGIVQGESACS